MVELLHASVGRDGRPQTRPRSSSELGGRLLAEAAEQLRRPLQLTAPCRVRQGDQTDCDSQDDGIDAGLEQRHPSGHGKQEVDEAVADGDGAGDERQAEDGGGDQQRRERDVGAVDEGDDGQRDDIVDDDDRRQQ